MTLSVNTCLGCPGKLDFILFSSLLHLFLFPTVEHACLSSPCMNGATCVEDPTGFSCICTESWTGNTCTDGDFQCHTHTLTFTQTPHLHTQSGQCDIVCDWLLLDKSQWVTLINSTEETKLAWTQTVSTAISDLSRPLSHPLSVCVCAPVHACVCVRLCTRACVCVPCGWISEALIRSSLSLAASWGRHTVSGTIHHSWLRGFSCRQWHVDHNKENTEPQIVHAWY